jgi:hypothetical protein
MPIALRDRVVTTVVATLTALAFMATCSVAPASAEEHFCTAGTNWDNSIQACR